MKNQKHFFLMSFLPAIAYWYLETHYDLKTALIGGLLLAVIEIILEKVFTKHVHAISKFNFYLILVLGSIGLVGDEGIWFKLQPFFTGLLMGGYLLFRASRGNSLMIETMEGTGQRIHLPEFIEMVEKHLARFLIAYGFFMAYIAIYQNTDTWLFFKTGGFYIVCFIFFGMEMFFMRRKMKGMSK